MVYSTGVATTLYRLVDTLLGGQLPDRLRQWRAAGVSYAAMARLLSSDLDLDISDETLRRWCQDLDSVTVGLVTSPDRAAGDGATGGEEG